jgi:hypothetical protein
MLALVLADPAVALTCADPAATALTSPLPLTLATALFVEAHVIDADMVFPLWSFTVAVSCSVAPNASSATLARFSVTVVGTGVGGLVPPSEQAHTAVAARAIESSTRSRERDLCITCPGKRDYTHGKWTGAMRPVLGADWWVGG